MKIDTFIQLTFNTSFLRTLSLSLHSDGDVSWSVYCFNAPSLYPEQNIATPAAWKLIHLLYVTYPNDLVDPLTFDLTHKKILSPPPTGRELVKKNRLE